MKLTVYYIRQNGNFVLCYKSANTLLHFDIFVLTKCSSGNIALNCLKNGKDDRLGSFCSLEGLVLPF